MSRSPYARTRNRQLVRVLSLLALLENGWWTLNGLSVELAVSTRTVRRDLAAVKEAHLPVVKARDRSDVSHWRIRRAKKAETNVNGGCGETAATTM